MYLRPFQTSMIELLREHGQQLKVIKHFCEVWSLLFDKVQLRLCTHLIISTETCERKKEAA